MFKKKEIDTCTENINQVNSTPREVKTLTIPEKTITEKQNTRSKKNTEKTFKQIYSLHSLPKQYV